MTRGRSFAARLTLALALLLLAYGAFAALLGRHVASEHEQESLQRLSHGLARHIVANWPAVSRSDPDEADREARDALLKMLAAVNPGVQAYVLDADGTVRAYIGEPGMVREHRVALAPIRDFLAGAKLPIRSTDPMGSGTARIFSAAMFAPRAGESRPPGYLYIVLDGPARDHLAGQPSLRRVWQGAAIAAAIGLVLTLAIGAFALRRVTRPLHRLATRMRAHSADASHDAQTRARGDEIDAIDAAFEEMTRRIAATAERERRQADAQRETMASVAHDLRTPLTALHGHLEALVQDSAGIARPNARVVAAALAQSDKVRRLSQQLFELAALQAGPQIVQRERLFLDELVADTVGKFELSAAPPPVTLAGAPPGRVELTGDLQLIERALDNLIDNAMRHAPGGGPVRVSLARDRDHARIVVEDAGPGLPADLRRRLESGQSLRDPPLKRPGGGIGGIGLAIAQRIATLHGGSLVPLQSTAGGTRLCLTLPLE